MRVNLKALIGKLNAPCRNALEASAGLCLSRTHYNIEIEHYIVKLMESAGNDAARIFRWSRVNESRLSAELAHSLDRLKSGNARTPAISPSVLKMLAEAWTIGSIDYDAGQIRSGFTILALVADEELARIMHDVSREFQKIEPEALKKEFISIISGSLEDEFTASAAGTGEEAAGRAVGGGKTPHLDQYTVNLTEHAKSGKIDPVLGRDSEVRQIIDILMRRRQNNPILTGEAGVGKTAVVEGFALRIVNGDVPPPLKSVVVRTLDLALLQAGAGVKGEFENRLKGVIEDVKSSPAPIILFIDEAHTMIGAGGQVGQNDAANLLKPALARGELRTIAATTWSEYKKYFEKDPALARRFQVVKVEEPAEQQCMVMMRGLVSSLEKHHQVRILDDGVAAAVRLSHRYLVARQLPDKAVSVLDTACARLALGQHSTPPVIEDTRRQIADLNVQERVLTREATAGANHADRLESIKARRADLEVNLQLLEERFQKESRLVAHIRQIRNQLEEAGSGNASLLAELDRLNKELEQLQGEAPLTRVCVDAHIVGEVISAWTGIPVGRMLKDEVQLVLDLESHLGARVIGQGHALEAISQRIRTSRANLEDPNKPIGVFLLVGPSGVGKTETAHALADFIYGGERNLITINMSEFQEPHTVSTLKGSPPGYVGYGEGGVLTEAVRRRPYSVVLLDEVEKAHPDVLELFFQVFDKGEMEDGEGRRIDFKNTIIILTSNAASGAMGKLCADPETMPSPEGIVKAIRPELNRIFKPAFLGRTVIIPYYPVRDEALHRIVRLKLGKIQTRIRQVHTIDLVFEEALVDEVARRCTEVESGARNVDNILTNTLLPEISRQLLVRIARGQKLQSIRIGVGDGNFTYSFSLAEDIYDAKVPGEKSIPLSRVQPRAR